MIKIPKRYDQVKYQDVPEPIRNYFDQLGNEQHKKSIYLHGAVGTGKTHTAFALAKKWDAKFDWTRFWNVSELLFETKEDFARSREDRKGYAEQLLGFTGLLVLDDMGAEKATEFVGETLYMIINNRYNDMLPTVITSNLTVAELADKVGDRVASRITEMCKIFELGGYDRRLKKI